MAWHEGELEMQRRAGVRDLADRVARIINADIPPVAAAFVAAQPFVIVSTVDASGQPTASLLGGSPGFARAYDARTLTITPTFGHDVFDDIAATGMIGILAIDPSTRRRMRVNGTAVRRGDAIVVTTQEVYSNCPQYIRPRTFAPKSLTEASREVIAKADTFFLATAHPQRGADASHRGGAVHIESPTRLTWPDLPGNNMFNSLGNLAVNPRCGLLFVDFERAAALRLRGRAVVEGDEERRVIFESEGETR
jgi:predicted pyridoxine 5'-phosphate oxidase superfamily flavin-nucleotide-binding protein